MQIVSTEFLAAIRGPHRIVVSVESSTSPHGPWSALSYSVSEGSVSIDRGDIRRTLSLTLVGWSDPDEALDTVSPYSTFIRVRRGIVLPSGPEYVNLGVFRVYEAKVVLNSMEITGYSQEVDLRDEPRNGDARKRVAQAQRCVGALGLCTQRNFF